MTATYPHVSKEYYFQILCFDRRLILATSSTDDNSMSTSVLPLCLATAEILLTPFMIISYKAPCF